MSLPLSLAAVFVLAYGAIAFEQPLKIDKSASALLGAGVLWTLYAAGASDPRRVAAELSDALVATAQVVFFLMGAMAIVLVIDRHDGFDLITRRIRAGRQPVLMVIVALLTFLLSAVLDNLTTTILIVSLLRRLIREHEDRLLFVGMVVIAANAGGAWSPIGDVTTTMLWVGGQITSEATIRALLPPALACVLVPLAIAAFVTRGRRLSDDAASGSAPRAATSPFKRGVMLFLGLAILVGVPIFKSITQLPPFIGMLLGLGILWLAGDLLHRDASDPDRQRLTLAHVLGDIDLPSIMFFVGILLAVATLEHSGLLASLAATLERTLGREDLIVLFIGVASAVVDNVPLVAASIGMYGAGGQPTDAFLWQFLAYCAGTGGSILIIGSAAGVAAMGIERIGFGWYLKRVTGLAVAGYLAGAGVFLALHRVAG